MKPDQINLVNMRNSEKITFDAYVSGPEGILLQNFDPGKIPVTFNSTKGVNQVGATRESVDIEVRTVTIEGAIIAEEGQAVIDYYKAILDRLCNPQDDILIAVFGDDKSREIIGTSDGTVVYSVDYRTSNSNILSFKLSFECFNPYFVDKTENVMKVETWIGGIEFPLEFIAGGIEFATKGPDQVEIDNLGDIDAPIDIYFMGPATNPKITLNGDKFIKINKTVAVGSILYISAGYDEIIVEINQDGLIEDGYNYIDIDSDFFTLDQGVNVLAYETETDIPQSVILKYKNHYFSF